MPPDDADARPDVSVLIIAWNVIDELPSCLQSIRDHADGLDVEVVLVDNGSDDGTSELVSSQFPEVQLVRRPENEGIPARNHALRRARGRYRMFLDSDARLTSGALTTMVAAMEDDPTIGLIGPRLVYPTGELQLSTRRYPPLVLPFLRRPPLDRWFEDSAVVRHHLMADDDHGARREVEYVLGACQLFSAEAHAAAGEIDERVWFGPDDADWCFRIRLAGYSVVYLPDATVVHDYRRTSASRPISKVAFRQLMAFYYCQVKWIPVRRRLRVEGRAMDEAAAC